MSQPSQTEARWLELEHEAIKQAVELFMLDQDLKRLEGMTPKRSPYRAAHEVDILIYHGALNVV